METKQFAKKLWISFGIIVVSIAIAGGALYFFSGDLSANADAIVAARAALNQQTTAVENLASLKQQAVTAAQYQATNPGLTAIRGGVKSGQWSLSEKNSGDPAFSSRHIPSGFVAALEKELGGLRQRLAGR